MVQETLCSHSLLRGRAGGGAGIKSVFLWWWCVNFAPLMNMVATAPHELTLCGMNRAVLEVRFAGSQVGFFIDFPIFRRTKNRFKLGKSSAAIARIYRKTPKSMKNKKVVKNTCFSRVSGDSGHFYIF